MDNLDKLNIDNNILNKLDDNNLLELSSSYDIVNDNIILFNKLGIKNINDIILYNPNIFLNDTEYLFNLFKKYDIKELVEKINLDYTCIDNIF